MQRKEWAPVTAEEVRWPPRLWLKLIMKAVIVIAACQANATDPIRFAVGTTWAPPYAEFSGERMTGGIVFELATELSKSTRRQIVQVPLPRKRLESAATDGLFDLHCYFNPNWANQADNYQWTKPLFEIPDVLVANSAAAKITSLKTLPVDTVIGTVIGYHYPSIDPDFDAGRLKREDANDQEKVLQKVSAGRTLYGVSNLRAAEWFKRKNPTAALAAWQIDIAQADFYCAVPKSSALSGELLRSLNKMKQDGVFLRILNNYR